MKVPLEISYRNVPKSDTIEELIREKAAGLDRVHSNVTSCRVAVEKTQAHQDRGSPYRVRVDITVPPGHEIYVTSESTEGTIHQELTTIIRSIFRSARRQLRELADIQRGETQDHPGQEVNAVIEQLHEERGARYGFLRDVADGRLIYFHQNSVLDEDFEDLEIGLGVHYVAEIGDQGLQATTVRVIGKPPR